MNIIRLGDGSVAVSEGGAMLEDGFIGVGVMFKEGAGQGVGVEMEPLPLQFNEYDVAIISDKIESLLVLREMFDRAIENFPQYLAQLQNGEGVYHTLTRAQALTLMKNGFKVTHEGFTSNEYLHWFMGIKTEDGHIFDDVFLEDRFDGGWKVFKEQAPEVISE